MVDGSRFQTRQQNLRLRGVSALASGHQEFEQTPPSIHRRMKLGGQAPTTPPDAPSLVRRLFFSSGKRRPVAATASVAVALDFAFFHTVLDLTFLWTASCALVTGVMVGALASLIPMGQRPPALTGTATPPET